MASLNFSFFLYINQIEDAFPMMSKFKYSCIRISKNEIRGSSCIILRNFCEISAKIKSEELYTENKLNSASSVRICQNLDTAGQI